MQANIWLLYALPDTVRFPAGPLQRKIEIGSHPFKSHFVEEVVSKCLEHSIKLMFTGNARIRLKRIREAVVMKQEIIKVVDKFRY